MVATYRSQHSVQGDAPLYCGPFMFQAVACHSPVANVTFEPQITALVPTGAKIGLKNSRVDIVFGYGLVGSRDGVDLFATGNKTELDADRYFTNIGFDGIIDTNTEQGRANVLPRAGPADQQSLIVVITLHIPKFAQELIYDPDISFALVFDVSTPPTPSSVPLSAIIEAVKPSDIGIAVGVTASIIVVGAAVVGLVLWQRKRRHASAEKAHIARRLKSSEHPDSPAVGADAPTAASAPAEAPSSDSTRRGSKWQKSSLRDVRATNVNDD